MAESRYSAIRASGETGRIEGAAITYGEIAQIPFMGPERFTAGAFEAVGESDVILDVQHDRGKPIARTGGGGLSLIDSESKLSVEADLTKTALGRAAYEQVKARILRGLSVHFNVIEEHLADGVRTITRAKLISIGLVDKPAYEGSNVQARSKSDSRPGEFPAWL